jgi:hypothetical protein
MFKMSKSILLWIYFCFVITWIQITKVEPNMCISYCDKSIIIIIGYVAYSLEISSKLGIEPSGSIKCWETMECPDNWGPLEWCSTP